jgi:hypothetical protein
VVKGCRDIQVEQKIGVILPVGAFVEGESYPSWMQIFSKPFIAFILYFLYFLFLIYFKD